MVLLEKLWDDVLAGPQPDRGLGKLRKIATPNPLTVKGSSLKHLLSLSLFISIISSCSLSSNLKR